MLAFRLTGKRQVGQLTPFDLIVLLLLSSVVQNVLIGNDNSLGGGLIGALVLLALNYGLVELTFRSKLARGWLEASPTVLVHNGVILHANLRAAPRHARRPERGAPAQRRARAAAGPRRDAGGQRRDQRGAVPAG